MVSGEGRPSALDNFAAVVGLVCIVTLTTVLVVYTIRGDRYARRVGAELTDAAQKLREATNVVDPSRRPRCTPKTSFPRSHARKCAITHKRTSRHDEGKTPP